MMAASVITCTPDRLWRRDPAHAVRVALRAHLPPDVTSGPADAGADG
jgi:hypothetical protein